MSQHASEGGHLYAVDVGGVVVAWSHHSLDRCDERFRKFDKATAPYEWIARAGMLMPIDVSYVIRTKIAKFICVRVRPAVVVISTFARRDVDAGFHKSQRKISDRWNRHGRIDRRPRIRTDERWEPDE